MTIIAIISTTGIVLFILYFVVNKVKTPFSDWNRTTFQERLVLQAIEFGGERWMIDLFNRACTDSRWTPSIEFDGCTTIQDLRQPCAPCFVHDWMWKTGQGGKVADKIFFRLLIATGCNKTKARIMFVLVRIGWATVYRRKHLKDRNVNKYDQTVLNACAALKIKI